jgi:DNA-binding HxlR family transcriptional regulator
MRSISRLTADPSLPPSRAALAAALEAIGDRWSLLIVAALLDGPRRFGELQREVAGIAPNVLSDRLRKLELAGVVIARPYSARPPRFIYELTASGAELSGALALLAGWGARRSPAQERPTHALCGSALEVRWWCPTCDQVVSADDEQEQLHLV